MFTTSGKNEVKENAIKEYLEQLQQNSSFLSIKQLQAVLDEMTKKAQEVYDENFIQRLMRKHEVNFINVQEMRTIYIRREANMPSPSSFSPQLKK